MALIGGKRAVLFGQPTAQYYRVVQTTFGSSVVAYWPLDERGGTVATDAGPNGCTGAYSNVALGYPGIGDGSRSPLWLSTGKVDVHSAALTAALNPVEITIALWYLPPAWSSSRTLVRFGVNSSNYMRIRQNGTGVELPTYTAGGTTSSVAVTGQSALTWQHYAVTISKSNNRALAYLNGTKYGNTQTVAGNWSGTITTYALVGSASGSDSAVDAQLAHVVVLNREASAGEIAQLASVTPIINATDYYYCLGDSKTYGTADDQGTVGRNGWPTYLAGYMGGQWQEYPVRTGKSGWTVAMFAASIATDVLVLNPTDTRVKHVRLNLGANDVQVALPVEATWKANYQSIINGIHATFSGAKIWIDKPWVNGQSANCDTVAGWIDDLIAANASVCFAGLDERSWLAPHYPDWIADGIHPNHTGHVEQAQLCAAQLLA